ncbi:MAG: hypothetical protein AB1445_01455 [Bacillota bacterium]
MKRFLGLSILLVFLGAGAGATSWAWPPDRLQGATFAYVRPGWDTRWDVPSSQRVLLEEALRGAVKTTPAEWPDHYSWYRLELQYRTGRRTLYISPEYLAYCQAARTMYSGLDQVLPSFIAKLDAGHFGEPLEWAVVSSMFARKSRVRVTDLDTGRSFWLFRYGGDLHADVEPATAEDAEIMRSIFGEWTWRRRAVVVELGDRRVAASLHAMPHGGGNIRDNEFDGHVCLHFAGSLTHGSRRADPAHRIMVLKAAGRLTSVLWEPDPVALAGDYLVLLVQKDLLTLDLMTSPELRSQLRAIQFTSMLVGNITILDHHPLAARLSVEAVVYRPGDGTKYELTLDMVLRRPAPGVPWQVHQLNGL